MYFQLLSSFLQTHTHTRMHTHNWTTLQIFNHNASEKGSTPQGKNWLPTGSHFFSCRVDPFPEGTGCAEKQTGSHKRYLPCTKWQKTWQVYCIILKESKGWIALKWQILWETNKFHGSFFSPFKFVKRSSSKKTSYSEYQRRWSACADAQADLRFCCSHIY